ncbi:hypothetical protein JTB14_033163 [Gonioctena quinquepunctata]|nr:hypothetical protein JTB14_033163 [Gonioctena quinquepunctata]
MDKFTPNVSTRNSFAVLSNPDPDEPRINHEDIPVNKGKNCQIRLKPPPIIVRDKKVWPAISQLINNLRLKSDEKFQYQKCSKTDKYKKCLSILDQHKVP